MTPIAIAKKTAALVSYTVVTFAGCLVCALTLFAWTAGFGRGENALRDAAAFAVAMGVFVASTFVFLEGLIRARSTAFYVEGIAQRRLFQSVFIAWGDVVRVGATAGTIRLRTEHAVADIQPRVFASQQEVLALLDERLEPQGGLRALISEDRWLNWWP